MNIDKCTIILTNKYMIVNVNPNFLIRDQLF